MRGHSFAQWLQRPSVCNTDENPLRTRPAVSQTPKCYWSQSCMWRKCSKDYTIHHFYRKENFPVIVLRSSLTFPRHCWVAELYNKCPKINLMMRRSDSSVEFCVLKVCLIIFTMCSIANFFQKNCSKFIFSTFTSSTQKTAMSNPTWQDKLAQIWLNKSTNIIYY